MNVLNAKRLSLQKLFERKVKVKFPYLPAQELNRDMQKSVKSLIIANFREKLK